MTHEEPIKLISIHHSTIKNKKYVAVLKEGNTMHTVHFGAKGYSDFTLGAHRGDLGAVTQSAGVSPVSTSSPGVTSLLYY